MNRERQPPAGAEDTLCQPTEGAPAPLTEAPTALAATAMAPTALAAAALAAPVEAATALTPTERASEVQPQETLAPVDQMATQIPTQAPEGSESPSIPSDVGSGPSLDSLGAEEWDKLPPPVFEVGRAVFGKYRLLEKIGEGGMGEVWRVTHLHLETERALKMIRPEFVQSGKGWRRFRREAQLMAKIDHPHAVAVYDFKRAHSMGYIEMELVRGRSLQQILKAGQGAAMPLARVAEIVDQLCDVLQAAHEHIDERSGKSKPIIHRDLKPSNLMLIERKDREGETRLKVLDFGIAKMIEDDGAVELTGAGDLVGTPAYMSPEQIRGGFDRDNATRPIEARSDIYSTGVVLYHLLTGSPPFQGNKMTVLAAHLNSTPRPFKLVNPAVDVPAAVEAVVLRCLEKDPDQRPASARELKELFRQAVAGAVEPVTAVSTAPETVAAVVPASSRVPRYAFAAVAAAVIAVGLFAAFRGPGANAPGSLANTSRPTLDPKATLVSPTKTPGSIWSPEGYVVVDDGQRVAGKPSLPLKLRRSRDSVEFDYYKDGLYLPVGYSAESAQGESLVGRWPKVVVRQRDGVRFIRIPGGVFRRGDTRGGDPLPDSPGNPCTPHYVRVPSFYIQESEVTNGEIKYYLANSRPEDQALLDTWQKHLEDLSKSFDLSAEQLQRYPAVGVDARVARRYAASVGGLLPTESEFEFAAKSCIEPNLFSWGQNAPAPGQPPRANLASEANTVQPAEVMKTLSDKTDQGVFDMTGNVREICADLYEPYSVLDPEKHASTENPVQDQRESDATSEDAKAKVVVRGGSFLTPMSQAYAFYRWRETADAIPDDVGFRVVLECPEAPEPE